MASSSSSSSSSVLVSAAARARLAQQKTMLLGGARLTVGPVRFHPWTFCKQLLYHILPWPCGGILAHFLDGEQAAVNQLLTVRPRCGLCVCSGRRGYYAGYWIGQRLQDACVLGAFTCYFAGVGLSTMEAFLVLVMWGSRMLMIAVKYAYLDTHELRMFHAEIDTKASLQILSSHLLSSWTEPTWLGILREVSFASHRANLKGSQAWYTRNKGLRLPITFVGPGRCAKVLDLLDPDCWDHPGAIEADRASASEADRASASEADRASASEALHVVEALSEGAEGGVARGANNADNADAVADAVALKLWQCPRARLKFGRIKGLPRGYSTRDPLFEAHGLFRIDVPAGLLLSAIIYKNVIEGRESGLLSAVRIGARLLAITLIVTPLVVRLSVPELPPESVLVGLNMSMGVDATLRALEGNGTTMARIAAAAAATETTTMMGCGPLGMNPAGAAAAATAASLACLGRQIVLGPWFWATASSPIWIGLWPV